MLKADLADAKIPYVDDAGRYADFHCLRHTTGSLLAASGVHPKVAQSIMRHGDINLTMSLYTHTLRGQESEAIKSLPDLSLPNREKLKASGTDDKVLETDNTSHKSSDMTMLGTEKALLSSGDIDFKHHTPELAQNSAQRIQCTLLKIEL
jgi:hypothetical protein